MQQDADVFQPGITKLYVRHQHNLKAARRLVSRNACKVIVLARAQGC
jgi:hypothetical protein